MYRADQSQLLETHTPELFRNAVALTAERLRAGGLVALPTETVYGLAANAFDPKAVARIFEIKGRPAHNPIIVHVSSIEMARQCVEHWPPLAEKLARAFWPGPLTLVLPRSDRIPDVVTSGGPTVGIRWPSHPFFNAVLNECGFPLAAPSANRSNELSPTSAAHVQKSLAGRVPLIVDGGQCQVGIESTVIDLTESPPRALRPGMIHDEALIAVTGALSSSRVDAGGVHKSPGLLEKHYSPKAKLLILSWQNDADLACQISKLKLGESIVHVISHTRIPSLNLSGISVIPHDAEAFARAIYSELHRCDETGTEFIILEALPNTSEWQAINDRMRRAAAK